MFFSEKKVFVSHTLWFSSAKNHSAMYPSILSTQDQKKKDKEILKDS